MKDHEIAKIINKVRNVAKEFASTQQLRAQIASVLLPELEKQKAMHAAMQEFVDRCDKGEVRSTKTYTKFKAILEAK